MEQPQGAQRLEEVELPVVERGEILVSLQQVAELPSHRVAIAGDEHPQVLHRRGHARVVEIDEMRTAAGISRIGRPQDVARVAIAVDADVAHLARARER